MNLDLKSILGQAHELAFSSPIILGCLLWLVLGVAKAIKTQTFDLGRVWEIFSRHMLPMLIVYILLSWVTSDPKAGASLGPLAPIVQGVGPASGAAIMARILKGVLDCIKEIGGSESIDEIKITE